MDTVDSIDVHHKRQRPNNRTADPTTGLHHALPGLDDSDVDVEDDLSREAIQYLRGVRSEAAAIPDLLIASKPGVRRKSAKLKLPQKGPGPYGRQLLSYDDDEDDEAEDDPVDEADADDDFSALYEEDSSSAPGGYYDDGAYIAAPPIGPQRPPSNGDLEVSNVDRQVDADTAFHASLLARFTAHRLALRQQASPTPRPMQNLSSWQTGILSKPPLPKQLANMDYDSTFAMLGIVTELVQRKQVCTVAEMKRLGSWVWSLLAKVEELGTLSSEEVSIVREVGKSAVQVIKRRILGDVDDEEDVVAVSAYIDNDDRGYSGDGDAEELGEIPAGPKAIDKESVAANTTETASDPQQNGNNGAEDDGKDEDIEAARARLLRSLNADEGTGKHNPPKDAEAQAVANEPDTEEERTKQQDALLDMIFTIVGEAFGQRDLLAARDTLWDVSST